MDAVAEVAEAADVAAAAAAVPWRLERLRAELDERELPGLLVSDPLNRRYLSGFTGSAGVLLITAARAFLVTDFRYEEAAGEEAPAFDLELIRTGERREDAIGRILTSEGIGRLGFEAGAVSFSWHSVMCAAFAGVDLVPTNDLVERIRQVKDDGEVNLIRRAVAIAESALGAAAPFFRAGCTEGEAARELEFAMRRLGAEGAAFPSVVASGPNTARPHAMPTGRRLAPGDLVIVDFGARFAGYCSDITRTFVVGEAGRDETRVHEVVLEAQRQALSRVRPGANCAEVDAAARAVITAAGFGERFGHGTGHGVGLAVHEGPRLGVPVAGRSDDVLVSGMVVTIEPGIYIPGWGGVRIEDTVLVTDSGFEVLSRIPRVLRSL